MTNIEGTRRNFVAGEALEAFKHVKLSAGTVVHADAGEAGIGFTVHAATSGYGVSVELLRPTVQVKTAGAVTLGASVYPAADGTIDDVENGDPIGIALEAATATGDIIEILPFVAGYDAPASELVEAKTANYTVLASDSGKVFTNAGATDTVVLALPVAAAGYRIRARVAAAFALRLDPNGSETLTDPLNGSVMAAGKYIGSSQVGATIELVATATGGWVVMNATGAWDVEDSGRTLVKAADYTVLVADNKRTFVTTGASGAVTFAMPAATVGLKYRFLVGAAQELRIDPNGTETIALPSTGVQSSAGAYITANAAGESVDIECVVAGTWSVFGYTGTWTAV